MKAACCGWLAAGFVAVSIVGCGPRVVRYPVEGVVTLDGKPIKGASVTFMPKGKGRPGIAETDVDGRFAIKELGKHEGVAPGPYGVAVFLAEFAKPKVVRVPSGLEAGGKPKEMSEVVQKQPSITRYIVPERYSTAETSGFECDIAGPTTGVTLVLTTKK